MEFVPVIVLTVKREDVKDIFEPLIVDIERLVEEQVNLVKIKKMSESQSEATPVKGRTISWSPASKAL